MAQRQVVLTYQKPGTNPPVFVAGTFSNPPWQPQEMDSSVDEHGNHTFEKTVSVKSGAAIQYKFRLGTGDWWVCDDNIAKTPDAHGNWNNVLRMSALSVDVGDFEEEEEESEDAGPMFSHESFSYHDDSEYTASSDDGVTTPNEPTFRFPNAFKPAYAGDKNEDEIDFNDPTLEHFPHENRRSIIAELQRIETATEPDRSLPGGIAPSPLVSPMGSTFPPAIHEPDSPKRRTNAPRAALGSFASERSHISLASIDENAEEESEDGMTHNLQVPDDRSLKATFDSVDFGGSKKSAASAARQVEPSTPIVRLETPSGHEDEGISLNTANSKTISSPGQESTIDSKTFTESSVEPSAHSESKDSQQQHWLPSFLDLTSQLFSNVLFGNRRKT
ncbi:hypothetical protein PFICI_08154 [Pestalotiopsis fici W106-1]|uniref:AMP-activated protein kinase glycogen-binding domain-containing protein n=1 Tax=Pestalotiopsis fici (strain W106-1 / CGMCC3.15140) TaxID=1229662 RepID=W3X3H1_PESFW|nr:uncharacterized protein PFICI_08154 [Pestalotiopsis fici W106-1]ETS80625.1 hypothetical protein PFICI_08154 [Pestalotiopsis fici W106-1]